MTFGKQIYGLDLRSINLFRIALGTFMLAHLWFYVLANFGAMFSPESGVLGNGFAAEYAARYKSPEWLFSIDSDNGMLLFLGVRALFLLMFVLGFYPRLAAVISAVLLWFFQLRYNVLFLGWEIYAAVLISWAVFLPWGRKTENGRYEWRSPLAFIFLFQIGFIYFYNGISKNGPKWMDGTAVKFFLAEYDKARPLANFLFDIEWLTQSLTYYTLVMEVGLILILFIPYRNQTFRWLAAFLIVSLHWGIDLFVDVGYFKWYASCVALVLLPEDFWNKASSFREFVQKWLFPKREFSLKETKLTQLVELMLAIYLLFVVVESNLYQTSITRTSDRIKNALQSTHSERMLGRLMPDWWPQYSFFRQYWHLYSPDPPSEKGYMQFEFITDSDTIPVSEGHALESGHLYRSVPEKHLMIFLTLRKLRNEREKIALKAKLMHELKLWNSDVENPKVHQVQVVVYSYRPSSSDDLSFDKSLFQRQVLQTVDVDYGSN